MQLVKNWEEVRFRGWLGVGVCVGVMSLDRQHLHPISRVDHWALYQ